ncbi:hypothetical protein MLD38_025820 [Melastoma candidum]|uniref:Uncharacterized protein n=1 Tax=Melastoma candidum TaxID=119954 RepID=A0ACB9NXI8_9MYRT|nr:hypothetical protein MLD38_025820 [Melastoma candidum]
MGDRRGCAIASMSSYVLGVDITGGAAEKQGSWRLQVGSRGEMAAWFGGRAEAEVCQYPEVGGMSPSARGIGAIGSNLQVKDDEALIINCQNWLRYLSDEPDEVTFQDSTPRDKFLEIIRGLNPRAVIIVDEDVNQRAKPRSKDRDLLQLSWMPFDALVTFLPKDNQQRMDYESDIGHKINNVITFEGPQRIERPEAAAKLSQRMRNVGFSGLPFGDETVDKVKSLLDEHLSGWGMKREEDMMVLTWKGHSSVFAIAWVTGDDEF